jgi:hypothetical protein
VRKIFFSSCLREEEEKGEKLIRKIKKNSKTQKLKNSKKKKKKSKIKRVLLVGYAAMVAADLTFAFAPAALGMFAGAALVGVHMALTHGVLSLFSFFPLFFRCPFNLLSSSSVILRSTSPGSKPVTLSKEKALFYSSSWRCGGERREKRKEIVSGAFEVARKMKRKNSPFRKK